MNAELIYQAANQLKTNYKFRDFNELTEQLDIKLYYRKDFDKLLGLYAIIENQACIFLNARLDFYYLQMVLAHEIGHDRLHKDFAKNSVLGEHSLFDSKNRMEYEANAFASHLLIETPILLDYLSSGMTINNVANELNIDQNYVLIKLLELKKLGANIDLNRIPQMPNSSFLKNISV